MKTTGASIAAIGFALSAALPALASLHAGDKIAVTVFAHPELSTAATLDAAGNISLPLAGTVHAQSLATDQLASTIKGRLARYLTAPAVDVQLTSQNDALFIAGGPSGVLPYRPGETLVSVLDDLELPAQNRPFTTTNPHDSTTQGATTTQTAINGTQNLFDGPIDFRHVSVLRDARKLGPYDLLALRSTGQSGIALAPNDTIQLPNKPVAVRVTGEVQHPGYAYLDPTDSLVRALDQVGGVDDLASQTQIGLTRPGSATQLVSLGGPEFSQPATSGDELAVSRAPRVDVLGTVAKPGEQFLRGNQTLVSAIYYAGGPAQYANLKAVQVLHDGVKREYNLAALRKGHGGDNPPLVDGDVVFVPQGSTLDAQTIFSAIGALGTLGFFVAR